MNWLQLANLIIPAATNLILLFKTESGSTTAIISSTETATDETISQMQTWLSQHQASAPAAKPAAPPAA
jgi:hypothetical protein